MNKINLKLLALPAIAVILIWIVFWIEPLFGIDFTRFGIYPKDPKGSIGILFSPFIHSGLEHLYNNTIPLFVLLFLLQKFYTQQTYKVLFYSIIISGLFTWLIGRPSYHIGASGVIYALVSFIIFKGISTKNYRLSAISFLVIFLYGGMIWYMFPDVKKGISWEGHLGGFIAGLILSYFIKTPDHTETYKYEWEHPNFNPYKDPFMKHFDSKGNFVKDPHTNTTSTQKINFKYVIIPTEEDQIQNQ